MMCMLSPNPPQTEEELLDRCKRLSGLSFSQLAVALNIAIPAYANQRKGWIGQVLEMALGANAANQAKPDFQFLGIELKTLPLSSLRKPAESTFVTSIPLLTIHQQEWQSSQCYQKLKRVLWVPVEGDKKIPYAQRRIGQGFLWSPTDLQEQALAADWNYLVSQISLGYLENMDATVGEYLQIRPKGANGKSLCHCFDSQGNKVLTLPRGFYLRSAFTTNILKEQLDSLFLCVS